MRITDPIIIKNIFWALWWYITQKQVHFEKKQLRTIQMTAIYFESIKVLIFDSLWYILIVSCTSILNKASFIFLPSKHKLHVLLGFQLCCPCCHNIFILRFRVYVSAGNMWMWWGFLVGTNTRGLEECVWNNIRLTFFMAVWVWMCPLNKCDKNFCCWCFLPSKPLAR